MPMQTENALDFGYTFDVDKCELYAFDDIANRYGNPSWLKMDCPAIIKQFDLFCSQYKNYDTVLVDYESYKSFFEKEQAKAKPKKKDYISKYISGFGMFGGDCLSGDQADLLIQILEEMHALKKENTVLRRKLRER